MEGSSFNKGDDTMVLEHEECPSLIQQFGCWPLTWLK